MSDTRPEFDPQEVQSIVEELFGLAGSLHPLPSDRDLNWRLDSRDGQSFVLKFTNPAEDPAFVRAQLDVLERLRMAGLPVPTIVRTRSGDRSAGVTDARGRLCSVRLQEYLPGVPFAEVRPHSDSLLQSCGRLLGAVSRALADYSDPSLERAFAWDLARCEETVSARLDLVNDRYLLEHYLDLYRRQIRDEGNSLRRSVVHNDANDYNILVNGPAEAQRRAIGLIDFGDLIHSFTVSEIAVAAAYIMLDKPRPLRTAAVLLSAYHEAFPLEDQEIEVLYPLICMRLCISAVIAAEQQAAEPDNAYLGISQASVRRLLEDLRTIHPNYAWYTFRQACGLEPCPYRPIVTSWLRAHRGTFAPLFRADRPSRELENTVPEATSNLEPRTSNDSTPRDIAVLDFSVTSSDWHPAELTRPLVAADRIARLLEEQGASAGLGRYAEPRIVYTGDQFRMADGERRTIHLGVDVFQPVGSPVFAMMEGAVHSLGDNDRPFDYGPTIILEHRPAGGPTFYTLYGHLSRSSIASLEPGTRIEKGHKFAEIGSAQENGGWAPHLHFQLILDLLGREGEFPGVAAPSERELWMSLSPSPADLAGLPTTISIYVAEESQQILAARSAHVSASLSLSYRRPIHVVRGFKQYLYDADGLDYLDGVNNVAHVGHSHPRVVEAIRGRIGVLNTNTRYLYAELGRYAERLTSTLPPKLSVCYLVNSGSEANDLALRLARCYTGRRDVIVLEGAYHGHLTSLIEISPYKFNGPGGEGCPPHTHVAPLPDSYRGRYRRETPEHAPCDDRKPDSSPSDADIGRRYADHVRELAESVVGGPAAFFVESFMSCAGQIILPPAFLAEAFGHVRRTGGVCIADEVQAGFGRSGTHFWAFEASGAVPDIVTMGKSIGNGFPLAAVVTTREIAEAFGHGMEYFNTYGGNPLACAAGLAVLDVLEKEELQAHALRTGAYLLERLNELQMHHPVIGDVRGSGLFIGIELVRDAVERTPAAQQAGYVVERMRERRILLSRDGVDRNVLKLKPPMVFGRVDADRLIDALNDVVAEDFVRTA